jgi:hypothetical protein
MHVRAAFRYRVHGGTPAHPWTVHVAASVHAALEDAVASISDPSA